MSRTIARIAVIAAIGAAGFAVACAGGPGAKPKRIESVAPLAAGPPTAERPVRAKTGQAWADMDYGPFLTMSVELPRPVGNFAFKGVTIDLNNADAEADRATVVFDTDLMRYAGGWTGGFVNFTGIAMDGQHWAYPTAKGEQTFGNPMAPGWARGEDFDDPRAKPYGPIPRDGAHYKGLYLHGNQVILRYTVGDTEILESPGIEEVGEQSIFTRTLNIAPHDERLILQVAYEEGALAVIGDRIKSGDLRGGTITLSQDSASGDAGSNVGPVAHWSMDEREGDAIGNAAGQTMSGTAKGGEWIEGRAGGARSFDGRASIDIEGGEVFDFGVGDFTISAWVRPHFEGGTILAKAPDEGDWVPQGKALFIRDSLLTFDVGWVGAVVADREFRVGVWQHASAVYNKSASRLDLFLDGDRVGSGNLELESDRRDFTLRLGRGSADFPPRSGYLGRMDEVSLYDRALSPDEIRALAGRESEEPKITAAAFLGTAKGEWMRSDDSNARLSLPPNDQSTNVKVFVWRGSADGLDHFTKVASESREIEDLKPATHGGPPRWNQVVETQGVLGESDGPYAIDQITLPSDNPWGAWMRPGGFEFFEDESRAAVGTWNGDVWIVDGIGESLSSLKWRRIATGLFQPLGMEIVDGEIYVCGRDQITRLHDLNGDGEADYYENFNNDHMVSEHFHEFALDLQLGPDGDFYYTKGARHARRALHDQHGTLIRVSRDGSTSEIVAGGFRSPNGLGMGPEGGFMISDNQGHWTPANRINWVEPGGFYGNMWSAAGRLGPETYDPPLTWMPNSVDRSPGTFVWAPDARWGPVAGRMFTVSYGMGRILHVLHEKVGDVRQGGLVRLPLEFDSGSMRARFRRRDGQLYVSGLVGWSSNKRAPGGFYRVRYTGKPLHMPEELNVLADGVLVKFTDPLDPASVTDLGNFSVTRWNYKWTENYGSEDYKLDGTEGRDPVTITRTALLADGRTVFIEIPDIQPVMQMRLDMRLRAQDGAEFRADIHHTIHALGKRRGEALLAEAPSVSRPIAVTKAIEERGLEPGLIQTLSSADPKEGLIDSRSARLPALYVDQGESVSPFSDRGYGNVSWEGYILADINDQRVFEFEGGDSATLSINGEKVLIANQSDAGETRSEPVELRQGLNLFQLRTHFFPGGDSFARLFWSSPLIPREPVPPTAFYHDPEDEELRRGESRRRGRDLVAKYYCTECHARDAGPDDMPELKLRASPFDGIGDRHRMEWMARFILKPRAMHPNTSMPNMFAGADGLEAALEAQRDAWNIASYLAGLRTAGVDAKAGPISSTPRWAQDAIELGQKLYDRLGCVACHTFPQEGRDPPRLMLDELHLKWLPHALDEYIAKPATHKPRTRMPRYDMSHNEANALTALLWTRSVEDAPESKQDTPKVSPAAGLRSLKAKGCLNCHSLSGEKSELKPPAWDYLISRRTPFPERGCFAKAGPTLGRAPNYEFKDGEVSAIREFFSREEYSQSLGRHVPAEHAERQIAAFRCTACHKRDGMQDRWSALAPEDESATRESFLGGVIDDDGIETADPRASDEPTEHPLSIHRGRPDLTWIGEKLRPEWTEKLFEGDLPYKPRPQLASQMPSFPGHGRDLARGLAAQHGYGPESPPPAKPDPQLAKTGEALATSASGFNCIACHDIGNRPALAGVDTATVNLAHAAARLRPGYYQRFMLDPGRVIPGTQMPQFYEIEGNAWSLPTPKMKSELDAIWEFFISLDANAR